MACLSNMWNEGSSLSRLPSGADLVSLIAQGLLTNLHPKAKYSKPKGISSATESGKIPWGRKPKSSEISEASLTRATSRLTPLTSSRPSVVSAGSGLRGIIDISTERKGVAVQLMHRHRVPAMSLPISTCLTVTRTKLLVKSTREYADFIIFAFFFILGTIYLLASITYVNRACLYK